MIRPPYALDSTEFPFRELAAAAARAAIGGAREELLAIYMVARLCEGTLPPFPLPPGTRAARAAAARSWLSAVALSATFRASCSRVAEATAVDVAATAAALDEVIAVTAPALGPEAHSELMHLRARLRA
jgi:hypothetical protein